MKTIGIIPVVCALAFWPTSTSAQSCDIYPDAGCGSSIGHHVTVSGGTGGGTSHAGTCYKCTQGGKAVTPDHCHECGFTQDGEEGGDYALLIQAVEAGELSEVLRLAPKVPSRAVLNLQRSALQVRSCDGSLIVAHVPLESAALTQLRLAMPAAPDFRAELNAGMNQQLEQ